jgi:hypothetical protein
VSSNRALNPATQRGHRLGWVGFGCALAATACASQSGPAAVWPPTSHAAEDAGAPGVSTSSKASTNADSPSERRSRQLDRTWGWVLVGTGGAAGAVAIGTSVLMIVDKSTRDSDCSAAKVCSAAGLAANTQIADVAGWNTGAWILAAAGVGIGAFLLITNPTDRAKAVQVGVAPNGAGADLNLRAAF